jgi:hypothetical protein
MHVCKHQYIHMYIDLYPPASTHCLFYSSLFFFLQFPTSASTLFAEFVLEGAAVVEVSGGAFRGLGVWLLEGGSG